MSDTSHVSTSAVLARQVASGDMMMDTKTIYNWKDKTTEQIENVLMFVQEEFAAAHPDYEYNDLRYEDGKNGERTYFLMFKRKT